METEAQQFSSTAYSLHQFEILLDQKSWTKHIWWARNLNDLKSLLRMRYRIPFGLTFYSDRCFVPVSMNKADITFAVVIKWFKSITIVHEEKSFWKRCWMPHLLWNLEIKSFDWLIVQKKKIGSLWNDESGCSEWFRFKKIHVGVSLTKINCIFQIKKGFIYRY